MEHNQGRIQRLADELAFDPCQGQLPGTAAKDQIKTEASARTMQRLAEASVEFTASGGGFVAGKGGAGFGRAGRAADDLADVGKANRARRGAPRGVKDVLDNLPGKTGKTGPIKEVPDVKALDDLFDSLSCGGKTVNPGTYPGVVKELPDGTIVRRRPGSKSGGATLDITLPDGTYIKVHIKQ